MVTSMSTYSTHADISTNAVLSLLFSTTLVWILENIDTYKHDHYQTVVKSNELI